MDQTLTVVHVTKVITMSRVFLILAGICAVASAQDELKLVLRVFEECSGPGLETSPCLKMKLISALDRAARASDLEIVDGVHLIGDGQQDNAIVTEPELEASLPRALDDKEKALDEIIVDKVSKFVQSRSIQFKLNNLSEIPRSLGIEEGRRRRRGMGAIFMMILMMAGTMIPLKLGTLAVLAGKALIISKLALALAAIVGLKKLISSGDDHDSSYQVVQVPSHHSHHRRSVDLPYRAYAPKN